MEQSTRLLMEVMAQLVCMEEERSELEEERKEAGEECEEVHEEPEEVREEKTLMSVREIGQTMESAVQWYTVVLPIAAILAWTWKNRAEPAAQEQVAVPQATRFQGTPPARGVVWEGPLLHGVGHLDTDSCCRTDMEIGHRGGGPRRISGVQRPKRVVQSYWGISTQKRLKSDPVSSSFRE